MKSSEVSVIVPNYNHARFLRQRLESIYNQTYRDFELIILDDKSTDNSVEVIEIIMSENENSGIPVRFIKNETNSSSPFRQWKKGIEEARGEYVWIAESDDYADLLFLEIMMNHISKNNLDLCFCQSKRVNENGEERGLALEFDFHKEDRIFQFDDVSKPMGTFTLIPNASAVVFKRCKLPDVWSFAMCYKMSGDWVFWNHLIMNCDTCGYISTPYNYFRRHENSTCAQCDKEFKNVEEAFLVMRHFKEQGMPFNPNIWIDYWLSMGGYSVKVLFNTNFKTISECLYKLDRIALLRFFNKLLKQKYKNFQIKVKNRCHNIHS